MSDNLVSETITAPTDPQVSVWFVVECANECDAFEEGSPAGRDEAAALAKALSPDWGMTRWPDGKLYCQYCTEQKAHAAACASVGHKWQQWFSALDREYRQCERCSEHEQREVSQ